MEGYEVSEFQPYLCALYWQKVSLAPHDVILWSETLIASLLPERLRCSHLQEILRYLWIRRRSRGSNPNVVKP